MATLKKDSATLNSTGYVFCKYVVRNGKTIYPKNGKVFRFSISNKGGSHNGH